MSNKSRARGRLWDDEPAAEPEPLDPDYQAQLDDVAAMADAFDKGDTRTGISKWAGLVLRDRAKALATPDTAAEPVAKVDTPAFDPDAKGLREPTAYEASVLEALGNRTTVIDRSSVGQPPVEVHIANVSGGMYGGTVEPWRIEQRRARNKAARLMRRRQRRLAGKR